MKGEINKNFYCGGVFCSKKDEEIEEATKREQDICFEDCFACHHKWPTPEQFEEEYGEKWKGACYYLINNERWADVISWAPADVITSVVCACTPFGKPDDNWRPA